MGRGKLQVASDFEMMNESDAE